MTPRSHDHLDFVRIEQRIQEGEARREKQDNLEALLDEKIKSVNFPMQELELNYPVAKGKVYSEEEDRYLLCRLNYYGLKSPDVYDRIKKDITEFPVFRFDWFFKSRTPQELSRRCHTLLGMISKEYEDKVKEDQQKKSAKIARGTVGIFFFVNETMCSFSPRNDLWPKSPMSSPRDDRRPLRQHNPRSTIRKRKFSHVSPALDIVLYPSAKIKYILHPGYSFSSPTNII